MAKDLGGVGEKGYKTDKGKPPKRFYLGFDPQEAQARKMRLEQLWGCVLKEKGKDASWCGLTLAIAGAIAKGQHEVAVDDWLPDLGPLAQAVQLTEIQKIYPIIRLVCAHQDLIDKDRTALADQAEREADDLRGKVSGGTLHQALTEFGKWAERKHREVGTGKLKPYGKRLGRNAEILKRHHEDTPLSKFGLKAIEDMEDYWEARPKTSRSAVAAIDTAREQIKLVRLFVTWLNKSEAFKWRRPVDYSVRRMKIRATQDELAARANPEQVQRFTKAELKLLWEYATPLERLLICLGLNCGFGAAEVKSLYLSEIQGNFIKRIRRKTLVYGEWCLWDITLKALNWYKTCRRPKSDDPHLILSRSGLPLLDSAEGNNNPSINNWWTNLLDRIKKDEASANFRRFTFNKLRKTSGNYIRRIADGETMKVFHARGKPVETDAHSEVYSNRPFRKVFRAIRIMGKKLAPVFASVVDPFPAQQTKPHMTPGQQKRIKELRNQGYTLAKIGEIVGCTDETVRKYLRLP